MRYELTKSEAERFIRLCEKAEANGFKAQGFSFGDGKYYSKEFLYVVRDNGGFVEQSKPLTAQEHIAIVPNDGYYSPPRDSYTEIVKLIASEMRREECQQ